MTNLSSQRSEGGMLDEVVLHSASTSITRPSLRQLRSALLDARAAWLPIVSTETSQGSLEACFGQNCGFLSWHREGEPIKLAARSTYSPSDAAALMETFLRDPGATSSLVAWRSPDFPEVEKEHLESLLAVVLTQAKGVRDLLNGDPTVRRWAAVRRVSRVLAQRGVEMFFDGSVEGDAEFQELVTYELDLMLLGHLLHALLELENPLM